MAGSRSLGTLTVDLVAKTGAFEQGLDKASRKAKTSGKEIETALSNSFKAVGGFIAGFVASLVSVDVALRGFQQSVDAADRLDELSARFKISTETLSEWGYAAKLTGSDIEGLVGIIPKFSKTVADAADANSEAGKTFAALGISVKDQAGQLRSFQDLLPEIMDRFKGLNNETTETALAMQLFGRSGAEFLEFLNLGSDGLRTMGERARELGIVIDSETAAKAAAFKDRVDDLRAATQGWFIQVSSSLLPTLTDLTNQMTEFVREGGGAKEIADSIASSIRDIAEAIRFLGSIGDVFDRIRGGLVGLEKQGNAAFQSLNPFNWNPSDLARLKAQYEEGTGYVENGWAAMREAQQKGAQQFQVQLLDPSEGFGGYKAQKRLEEQAKRYQELLDKLLAGGDKPRGGGAKKSAAEQEAERLFQSYDSLAASLDQQIALFGETSEAAKVRYEVEFGSLVNLEPKLKNYLIYKAEELDTIKELDEQRKEEERLQQRELERIERGLEYGRQMVSDLQFEIDLMRMGNAERATAIQLRGMEAEAVQAYGEEIAELNRHLEEQMQRTQVMDGFRDSFANFFEDVIGGTSSVKDAFTDMLDSINRMLLQRITENWVEQLFGAMGTSQSGSAGGGWMSWFAGLFGGGKAGGGWAAANTMYEVNERGFEMASVGGKDYMLTGNKPVHITPNHRLQASGGGVTVNFNGYGKPDRRTAQQAAADVAVAANASLARNGRGGRG